MLEPTDQNKRPMELSRASQAHQAGLPPSPATPPDVPPLSLACIPASLLACGLACMQAGASPCTPPDAPPCVQRRLQNIACKRGLTPVQINVLGILLRWQGKVLAYATISAELFTRYGMKHSPGSVKEIVARLKKREIVRSWQARSGMLQGSKYNFAGDLLCPHINSPHTGPLPGTPAHTPPIVQAEHEGDNTILEQVARRNLSSSSTEDHSLRLLEALTEDSIAFHFPSLAKIDFSTSQVRQIISRLSQVGLSSQRVLEGLARAEWELSQHGHLRDGKGILVAKPLGYVFHKLAQEGCYPRPEGYLSQQEKAERDATEEAKARKAAIEGRFNAEFELWMISLIHPFLDGNGRIGRLLIPLYLVSNKLLSKPSLYLSDFFERNRASYYDALMRVRVSNDMTHWVRFFLSGVAETAAKGRDVFSKILTLRTEVEHAVLTLGKRAPNARKALNLLYCKPVVSAADVEKALSVSTPTANHLIRDLMKLSILTEITGLQRGRSYSFDRYLRLFFS